jgi:hypothetical protein
MPDVAAHKFEIRLAPTEGEADPVLIDDILRLIRQAIATASPQVEVPAMNGEFTKPDEEEQQSLRQLDSSIKHRIEQASAESRTLVEARAAKAAQPVSEAEIAEESIDAAANLVSAVQRAMIRGLRITVPDSSSING